MHVGRNTVWSSVRWKWHGKIYVVRTIFIFVLESHILCLSKDSLTASTMSPPLSYQGAAQHGRCPPHITMASKQTHALSTKKLPRTPEKKTLSASRIVGDNKQSYSPSLVQFSCPQKRARLALNLFSIVRLTLIAATLAAIPLGVIRARSTELAFVHFNVLKLIFVCASLVSLLSILHMLTSAKTACILASAVHARPHPLPL